MATKNSDGTDGSILSWGSNSHYQLALRSQEDQSTPAVVTDLEGISAGCIQNIGGGGAHTFIHLSDGSVFMCGWNKDGQVGDKSKAVDVIIPTPVSGLPPIKTVACGWNHTVVCTGDGAVFAWGSNAFGQLGIGKISEPVNTPIKLDPSLFNGMPITKIVCGMRHSACVTEVGEVFTWGSAGKGQLGRGGDSCTPGLFGGDTLTGIRFVDLALGSGHTVVLSVDGEIMVSGDNSYGQCGMECKDLGEKPYILKPVSIREKFDKIGKVIKIVSGWEHNLLLNGEGLVYSWGRCDYGQLGRKVLCGKCAKGERGTCEIQRIELGVKIIDIECGTQHCLVLSGSGVWSWGWNEHGMCGDGNEENIYEPFLVQLTLNASKIGCGNGTSFVVTKI